MTMNPKDQKDFQLAKKETDPTKFPSSSRQWSNNKNPRIVRVSRTFGGKDRHSKVRTVKGLRDRRIRLSVPTAIQLYDLQDRLGLGQPSKVVDWLIDATKNDIDELPPLPMIPGGGSFVNHFQDQSCPNNYINPAQYSTTTNALLHSQNHIQEGSFVAQNLFPLSNYHHHSSNFTNMPSYNSNYFHWDPQNLSLSQFGGGFSFSNQTDQDHSNFSGSNSNSHHPYFSSINNIPPIFPNSFVTPISSENNHVDMRSSQVINSHLQHQNSVTLALNVNSRTVDQRSEEDDNSRPDKGKRHS